MKATHIAATGSFILALALAGLSAAAGMGEEEVEAGPVSFDELDTDKDGYLSREEVAERAELIEQWKRADINQDDQLDTSEFSAFEAEGGREPAEPMGGATSVVPGD